MRFIAMFNTTQINNFVITDFITDEQYKKILGDYHDLEWELSLSGGWYQAILFCNKLSEIYQLPYAYLMFKNEKSEIEVEDTGKNGVRLPSPKLELDLEQDELTEENDKGTKFRVWMYVV
jgi:hypothetical protein